MVKQLIAKELFLSANSGEIAVPQVASFYSFTTAGPFRVNLIA
jgi:hypothetical protein